MEARHLLRLLPILVLPVVLAGTPSARTFPPELQLQSLALSPNLISAPRQSIPVPAHDDAICAFCQAAAFAPCAASPACGLPEAAGSERRELVSRDDRLSHAESSRPPRSRAPPILRNV